MNVRVNGAIKSKKVFKRGMYSELSFHLIAESILIVWLYEKKDLA